MPLRQSEQTSNEGFLAIEPSRRTAAILAADIAGYSRLMEADELGTHRRIATLRAQVIEPALAKMRGRLVKAAGDGFLAEFADAVDAVEYAVSIQDQTTASNRSLPDDQWIEWRLGLHYGDVIADRGDIFGGDVNIASRIEGVAEPGEIYMSGRMREEIRTRLSLTCLDLGERWLKNIQEPVRIFQIVTSREKREDEPTDLPEKPSIAVLPFTNMGGDDNENFCDGLTEDIITELSRFSGFLVIARNSTFIYKGRAVDVKHVGRELGVRYVLEGSVRRSGDRIRINAQLIDAMRGHHVWAERYDRRFTDIFVVQDEITQAVVASTESQIVLAEGQRLVNRPRPSLEVADLIRLGWGKCYELKYDSYQTSKDIARQIIKLDPKNARGFQILAAAIVHEHYLGLLLHPPSMLQQALAYAQHAVQLDENCEYSRWTLGAAYMFDNQHERGIAALRHAIELNPNFAIAYATLGTVLGWAGRFEAAIVAHDMSLRMNPRDPAGFFRFFGKALCCHLLGRSDDAVRHAEKCVEMRPDWHLGWAVLAVASLRAGRRHSAANYAERCRQLAGSLEFGPTQMPFADPGYRATILDDLQRAAEPLKAEAVGS